MRASLDQFNIPSLQEQKKSSPICELNLQNLAIFTVKCGKFVYLVANFAYFCGKICHFKWPFSAMPGLQKKGTIATDRIPQPF